MGTNVLRLLPLYETGLLVHDFLAKLIGPFGVDGGLVGLFLAGGEAGSPDKSDSGLGVFGAAVGRGRAAFAYFL